MRNVLYVLVIAAVCAAFWGTVSAVLITSFLDKRGIKTPFILMRLYFFRNVSRFREITVRETGKPGDLYFHCTLAFAAALILSLAALAVLFFFR
jgi:hypothetical protein